MSSANKNSSHNDLAVEIIDYLKLNGLNIGDRITERELAETFGVSRSPIRDALKILESNNVIEKRSNRGYIVAMSHNDMEFFVLKAPQSATRLLYDKITAAQISGKLPSDFTEQDLLDEYKVTRNILLKVLNRMWHEGLIEKKLGRGWECLSVISTRDANFKSYEFRLSIEPNILRSSTFKIDDNRLNLCMETHQKMIAGMIERMPASKIFEVNADFHQMLADFSQNDFFRDAVKRQNQLRRLMENRAAKHYERMLEACEEHIGIMTAIRQDNLESAANLMTYHLVRASRGHLGIST